MNTGRSSLVFALAWALLTATGIAGAAEAPKNPSDVYGPAVQTATIAVVPYSANRQSSSTADTFRYWNQITVDASGLDHTPVATGEVRTFGEQLGPGRSARAVAIVHIAIYDAVNSIVGGYQRYARMPRANKPSSVDAAIVTAAHDTLIALWPSQKPMFDQLYREDLRRIIVRNDAQKQNGIAIGRQAARLILAMRTDDNSVGADPRMDGEWPTSNEPGHWRQDPIGRSPIAMGAHWGAVKTFVLASPSQYRTPAPPAMTSAAYTTAFDEVKALGGDGVHTATQRTEDQTRIGIFWAYDGTPSLCAPPRLYNQVATEISKRETRIIRLVRLFALLNASMADAGIAGWESKYYWDVWRPVTGIREADPGTGPSGLGDGNNATIGDPTFWPLGAPASNLNGVDFTPPFPSYPSGHATFGAALFQTLRNFYGTDRIAFTFTSDEYNGETRENDGTVRPYLPRTFENLSQAEEENGQSRIYLGIHWAFDKTEGIRQGRRIANYVYTHAFRPQ